MRTLKWLLRWLLWLPFTLSDFNRKGAPAPYLLWQSIFIQVGSAVMILVLLYGYVFLNHIGADTLSWFLIALAIYLIIGLVIYFVSPKTGMEHDWRHRGAW